MLVKFSDVWIRTRVLWCKKWQLCQLFHNHCPSVFCGHLLSLDFLLCWMSLLSLSNRKTFAVNRDWMQSSPDEKYFWSYCVFKQRKTCTYESFSPYTIELHQGSNILNVINKKLFSYTCLKLTGNLFHICWLPSPWTRQSGSR